MGESEKPTTKLAAVELQALLRETVESEDDDRETVEIMPLVEIPDDEAPDPSKLARGSEAVAPQQKPLVFPKGQRRRRESLHVEQILPKPRPDGE